MQSGQRVYAFIDAQNLHISIRNQGWALDYRAFRRYLADRFNVTKAFYFVGYVPSQRFMYDRLKRSGYLLKFKPTATNKDRERKGNVDAELILCALLRHKHYDKAIIVAGDGDYYCLAKFLKRQRKLLKIIIPDRHNYSWLLRGFGPDLVFLNGTRGKLEYQKAQKN